MPSLWKNCCCACDTGDSYDYQITHSRKSKKQKEKARNKSKSSKATWTRRSLLENEQSEFLEIPFDQIAYQMKAKDTDPSEINEYTEAEFMSADELDKRRRRTAQEVFANGPAQSHGNKTTFPWMSEEFVPNGRSVTRLGISSVQINAKRNETVNKNNNVNIADNTDGGKKVSRKIYLKSQSFNDGQSEVNPSLGKPQIRTNRVQNNVRTVPNSHGFRGNITSVVNKGNTVAVPVGAGRSDRPLILHAPRSDVGIKVVNSSAHDKNSRVPKLGDYISLKPKTRHRFHQATDVRYDGQSTVPLTPFNTNSYRPTGSEDQSDISFSSEITYRKSDADNNHRGLLSLKRSKQPAIYSPNANKYERPRPNAGVKMSKDPKKLPESMKTPDTMYGYVPKAVQNVHASNALSGGKIDDFFMQRMHDRELEKFASIDRKETLGQTFDIQNIGKEQIANHRRPKSGSAYVNMDVNVDRNAGNSGDSPVRNNNDKTPYVSARIGLTQIKLKPPPNMRVKNSGIVRTRPERQPNIHDNYVNTNVKYGESVIDENDNKVIMIDFPPNVDKDKSQSCAHSESSLLGVETESTATCVTDTAVHVKGTATHVISTATHVESTSAHVESTATHVESTVAGVRNEAKLMINPLTESQEVLY